MILLYAIILAVLLVVGFGVVWAIYLGWHEKDKAKEEHERWYE